MKTAIYTERRTFEKYDDTHYIVYMGEQIIPGYVPDTVEGQPAPNPVTGYSYTGTETDGGTLIVSADADRDSLINGIIRSRYTQTEEDAIKTHQIELLKDATITKADEYEEEWDTFNVFRTSAISIVDGWLSD